MILAEAAWDKTHVKLTERGPDDHVEIRWDWTQSLTPSRRAHARAADKARAWWKHRVIKAGAHQDHENPVLRQLKPIHVDED